MIQPALSGSSGLDQVTDETVKASLIGLKKGDELVFDLIGGMLAPVSCTRRHDGVQPIWKVVLVLREAGWSRR